MPAFAWLARAPDDPGDLHYTLRPDSIDTTPTRFHPKAGKTLSPRAWRASFNEQGELDIGKVLKRIRKGEVLQQWLDAEKHGKQGVHPSIRGEVWEFLLRCFAPSSSAAEREALRTSRREQYAKLKAECQVMDNAIGSGHVVTSPRINRDGSPIENHHERGGFTVAKMNESQNEQENGKLDKQGRDDVPSHIIDQEEDSKLLSTDSRTVQWRLHLHQIGLDVVRTDRMLQFYERPENLAKLWDILSVYSWLDPDMSYCQGMSDFCSPLVVMFPNEADAFWCFEHIMHRVGDNFRCTDEAVGVVKQLEVLGNLMRVIDPKLHKHFESIGGGNYIFAFRMVMVLFRREFSFADTLYLWEMIWALEYIPQIEVSQNKKNSTQVDIRDIPKHEQSRGWSLKGKQKVRGKFERQNMRYGAYKVPCGEAPLALFCAAAIFEMQRIRLLKETKGLDEVLKLLNDITGKVDARAACKWALKLHKKYLRKVKGLQGTKIKLI